MTQAGVEPTTYGFGGQSAEVIEGRFNILHRTSSHMVMPNAESF